MLGVKEDVLGIHDYNVNLIKLKIKINVYEFNF